MFNVVYFIPSRLQGFQNNFIYLLTVNRFSFIVPWDIIIFVQPIKDLIGNTSTSFYWYPLYRRGLFLVNGNLECYIIYHYRFCFQQQNKHALYYLYCLKTELNWNNFQLTQLWSNKTKYDVTIQYRSRSVQNSSTVIIAKWNGYERFITFVV